MDYECKIGVAGDVDCKLSADFLEDIDSIFFGFFAFDDESLPKYGS
jgi:hypothetical protein